MIPKDDLLRTALAILGVALALLAIGGCSNYKTVPKGVTIEDNIVTTVVDNMSSVKTCDKEGEVYGCHFKIAGIHYIYSLPLESCIEHERKHLTGWEHPEGYRDDCHRDGQLYLSDKKFGG